MRDGAILLPAISEVLMPRWLLALASCLLVLGLFGVALARDGEEPEEEPAFTGEVLFGAQKISSLVDRDIIRVRPNIGRFNKVRFRALKRSIDVEEIEAIYADGKRERLLRDTRLRRNRKSKWVPLRHAGFIKELRVIYRSRPRRNRTARIEVFGEYDEDWLGSDGEGRKHNDGWVLLGTDTAGMAGFDKVTIKVGDNDGYKKLRVAVKNNDIKMRYLTVVYDDGSKDDVTERRQRVRAGKAAGPFELEKGAAIKEIRGGWRAPASSRRHRRYATVQVWGKP